MNMVLSDQEQRTCTIRFPTFPVLPLGGRYGANDPVERASCSKVHSGRARSGQVPLNAWVGAL
jgi:hypothetical protein